MRFFHLAKVSCLLPFVFAQDSSRSVSASTSASAAPSASASTSSNQTIITTTITSLIAPASGSASPTPTTFVLTLTLNSTSPAAVSSAISNSTISNNGTASNTTLANSTVLWKEGDDYLPFAIPIDPAYGVLGAVLILTGIPVAVLGGKNRWSSLAIASGYSFGLFTLIMILRFGVQPNIQPPSPNPPSQTLRGLYLLASLISAIIGGGIGIFLWKLAKYWVSAAGGFAFGWFLLAVRPGGLITNVIGRWGLLGGLTVAAFVASLPEALNPWLMLVGTTWIGATAFMLGVDCYTRAGLKEFYIYNLGYWDLYASLSGAKYPLTQTMSIELGILAAVVVVGAAIQFRVLNILQKRIKQLKDDEEAREDAMDVSKAAERFKNLESEQTEWEEKYGPKSGDGAHLPSGSGLQSPSTDPLPHLEFDPRRASSQLSLLSERDKGRYETQTLASPLHSPSMGEMSRSGSRLSYAAFDGAGEGMKDREELKSPFKPRSGAQSVAGKEEDELEKNIRLLEEVRQARQSIASSLDILRSQTPTGQGSRANTPTATHFAEFPTTTTRQMSGSSSRMLEPSFAPVDRPSSAQQLRPQSDWEIYTSDRRIISPTLPSPASLPIPRPMSTQPYDVDDRRERTTSMLEPRVSDLDFSPQIPISHDTYPTREPLRRTESASANVAMSRAVSGYDLPQSQSYVHPPPNRSSTISKDPGGAGIITGSASRSADVQPPQRIQRTMTYEELADRHRRRISKLQDPVSSKMNEEVAVAQAKEKWERQKKAEREEMRKREEAMALRAKEREREMGMNGPRPGLGGEAGGGRGDGAKKAEEWRRSVHNGLDVAGGDIRGQGGIGGQRMGERPVAGASQGRTRRMSSHLAN